MKQEITEDKLEKTWKGKDKKQCNYNKNQDNVILKEATKMFKARIYYGY